MKKVKKYLLVIGINIIIFFFLLELILHLVPLKITEYQSTIRYTSDAYVGYLPLPDQDDGHNVGCVHNSHVICNSLGMRGAEWRDNGSPEIALLGDSFLHALTIPDNMHLATLLSASTGGVVWNGGVSGYGTYQELLLWRKLMKPRKPDITIVFLFLENDIRDDQCNLCRAEGQVYSPCCEVVNDKIVERNDFEVRKPSASGLKAWIRRNCYTGRLISNLFRSRERKAGAKEFFDTGSFAYNVYRPELNQSWTDGWKITEWALKCLKDECDSVGSKLLVVNVPGVIQLASDPKLEMKLQLGDDYIPEDFDLTYPMRRLQAIADSDGINLLDLQPAFIAYRDKYKLGSPVFGWCCDGHWNPLGHRLAADLVQNYLIDKGWVTGRARTSTPSPTEVMGEKLYRQIYNCETIQF